MGMSEKEYIKSLNTSELLEKSIKQLKTIKTKKIENEIALNVVLQSIMYFKFKLQAYKDSEPELKKLDISIDELNSKIKALEYLLDIKSKEIKAYKDTIDKARDYVDRHYTKTKDDELYKILNDKVVE